MSVIIKGMKMPSECEYCGLCRYYPENGNVWCNAKNRLLKQRWKNPNWTHLDVKKPDWCPLVELPEKHGRLIDADALINLWDGCTVKGSLAPIIDARPTVVEAEDTE